MDNSKTVWEEVSGGFGYHEDRQHRDAEPAPTWAVFLTSKALTGASALANCPAVSAVVCSEAAAGWRYRPAAR